MNTTPYTRTFRGFTLLEVVIVLFIFTIMMLALVNFFISYNTSYLYDRAMASTANSAATVVNEAQTYVLQADQVVTSHTFGSTVRTSGSGTLVLELPAYDASGNIITNTYDYVAIYSSDGRIYRTIDASASSARKSGTKQLTDAVPTLTFTYNNADFTLVNRVMIDIATQLTVKGSVAQTHLTETVYLRNFPT
jgi:prepilin-type N-terminal cleavage/methylation domain-containing protein